MRADNWRCNNWRNPLSGGISEADYQARKTAIEDTTRQAKDAAETKKRFRRKRAKTN